jgi:hypothetical protein
MVNRSRQCAARLSRHTLTLVALCSFWEPVLAAGQTTTSEPSRLCARTGLADSAKVDQYVFRAYESDDGACLEVLHGSKIVYRRAGPDIARYTLGQQEDPDNSIPAISNGTDVTGRGQPDMIVSSYTGGAHCCTAHLVFELEPSFRLLATLNDADDDLAHFARMEPDKRYYYFTADWSFAYWPSCFACSPSAAVILRFVGDGHGGEFHLALDKMQTPAPSNAKWNQELRAAQQSASQGDINSIGTTLWAPILNLIYSGNSELAWKLVDEAGPKAQQSPLPTLADFCHLLKSSRYWPDLAPSLRDVPPACAAGAPQQ